MMLDVSLPEMFQSLITIGVNTAPWVLGITRSPMKQFILNFWPTKVWHARVWGKAHWLSVISRELDETNVGLME